MDEQHDEMVQPEDLEELTPFAKRIKRILDVEFGGNKSAMARAIGCESSAISNWLRRGRGMESQYAFTLQDLYHYDARWILEGEGDEKLPPPLTPEEQALLAKYREADEKRRQAFTTLLESP